MRAIDIFSVFRAVSRLRILPLIPLTLMVAMVISLFFLILGLRLFFGLVVSVSSVVGSLGFVVLSCWPDLIVNVVVSSFGLVPSGGCGNLFFPSFIAGAGCPSAGVCPLGRFLSSFLVAVVGCSLSGVVGCLLAGLVGCLLLAGLVGCLFVAGVVGCLFVAGVVGCLFVAGVVGCLFVAEVVGCLFLAGVVGCLFWQKW